MTEARAAVSDVSASICKVTDLTVAYHSGDEWLQAVRSVSFDVRRGEILAVVGETGSGKSTMATAVIRMLPANGRVVAGHVAFDGRELLALSAREMRRLRTAAAHGCLQPDDADRPPGR